MFEDRLESISTANRLDLPKGEIAKACAIDHRRITDFFALRPLPERTSTHIKQTIEKFRFVYEVFAPYRIELNTPELLQSAFENAQHRTILEGESING